MTALHFDGYTLTGHSRAGVATCICIPELRTALDLGTVDGRAVRMSRVLITHAHMDHCAAIPYYAARRTMMKMRGAVVYMPASLVGPMQRIVSTWEQLEGGRYDLQLLAIEPGEVIPLGVDHEARAFEMDHRTESLGYVIYRVKRKLRPELRGLQGREIAERRRAGELVDERVAEPMIGYTGDTTLVGLERNPEFQRCRVLVCDCSFLPGLVTPDKAHRHGHVHIADIAERPELLPNPHVVLTHVSERFRVEEIQPAVAAALPTDLLARVSLLVGEPGLDGQPVSGDPTP